MFVGVMAPVPGQKRLMIIKMVLENFKVRGMEGRSMGG